MRIFKPSLNCLILSGSLNVSRVLGPVLKSWNFTLAASNFCCAPSLAALNCSWASAAAFWLSAAASFFSLACIKLSIAALYQTHDSKSNRLACVWADKQRVGRLEQALQGGCQTSWANLCAMHAHMIRTDVDFGWKHTRPCRKLGGWNCSPRPFAYTFALFRMCLDAQILIRCYCYMKEIEDCNHEQETDSMCVRVCVHIYQPMRNRTIIRSREPTQKIHSCFSAPYCARRSLKC